MKIRIQSRERDLTIPLPTNLLFSRGSAWLADRVGRHYAGDAMKDLSARDMEKLFAELRRIKKRYGSWELVDVRSCDGEGVQVIL